MKIQLEGNMQIEIYFKAGCSMNRPINNTIHEYEIKNNFLWCYALDSTVHIYNLDEIESFHITNREHQNVNN